MEFKIIFPDADHVAQESQGKRGFGGGLVLEKKVNEALALDEGRGEEEVAFAVAVVGIDKRAGPELQLIPVDPRGEGRGNFAA